jgi:hypothetical protein
MFLGCRKPWFHSTPSKCWAPVVYACNPSYSGGRDQEDCGSKLAWANSWRDAILKIPNAKRVDGVAQVVELLPSKYEFKPQCCWAPVPHSCNLSYSGGRDQGDRNAKPSWANSLQDLISKIPNTKNGLVKWLKVKALSSSPSIAKKKKIFFY